MAPKIFGNNGTLLVDFGLSIGANIPTNVMVLGSATQGIIGTNVIGTFDMLADYSDRVVEISTQRTSNRISGPLVSYNAGTATVKLRNMDGALDPYVLEQAGLTAPGVIMRIRLVYDGWPYDVFYGYVDSWDPTADAPELGWITVTCTDGFALLNQKLDELVTPVGAGESVQDRVIRIFDAVGWPASKREIWETSSTMQATSFGDSALNLIQEAVKNEIGEFYQKPDGIMTMRGRHAAITDGRSATVQATFGSAWGSGEIPYVGRPVTAWNKDQLHNRVIGQIDGSTNPQVAENAESVGLYGTAYTIEETSLLLQTDADALAWANWVLATDYKPTFQFSAITLNSATNALTYTTPIALGREMGDRVRVIRRPPAQPYGSIVDSRELYIRGISHSWTAKSRQWLTTFDLVPVENTPFFVIGSATQGIIGTDRIAW